MNSLEKIWSWAFGDPNLFTRSPILHDFDSDWFFHNKTSFSLEVKTSSALPPYYSLELDLISSTSHSILSRAPGSRILMICCVSRAKMHIWSRKIDESWSFCVFFSIFSFSQFWMVLRCSHSEFRLRGLIFCSGLVSNRPDMKYQAYSNFRVHMVFMCRPILLPNHLKYSSIWHQTKTIR